MPRAGNEYILEWAPALKTLATLGLYVRPWITVDYWEEAKSVGRFEADFFDPIAWRPEYPNPAFDNMRPDDAFWAARLVARFCDEAIRAIVAQGALQRAGRRRAHRDHADQTARQGPARLADRRQSGRRAAAQRRGRLTFENAAVTARAASAPTGYVLSWSRFDNATAGKVGDSIETRVTEPEAEAPRQLMDGADYISVAVQTLHPDHPDWRLPVTFTFRRTAGGWHAVGLERTVPEPIR